MPVGDENLGEFARWQLQGARRDPRLDRGRGAMIADFDLALEEAERVRELAQTGLRELRESLAREEERLGHKHTDPDLDPEVERSLQAAWERTEMAEAELRAGHPHLYGQALLSMNSALDAMVEELVPQLRKMRLYQFVDQVIERADQGAAASAGDLSEELRQKIRDVAADVLGDQLPPLPRMRGSGPARYEPLLATVGLGAPADRPIPADMAQALAELGALRDVLVHRSGRVDARALAQASSLRYADGELIRITRDGFKTYSSAIRCYGAEVRFRTIRSWPEVSDDEGPDLANWRGYYRINA